MWCHVVQAVETFNLQHLQREMLHPFDGPNTMHNARILLVMVSLTIQISSIATSQCWYGGLVVGNDRGEGSYALVNCTSPTVYCISLRSANQRYNDVAMKFELRGCSDGEIPLVDKLIQCKGIGCQMVDFAYQNQWFNGEGCCCIGDRCNHIYSSSNTWRPQYFSGILFPLLVQFFFSISQ
ncbi:hypothetical protein Tcan_11005 [Toxocara canis]|uniref:Uncharacterized protein n=1 Tax=Toxocara canis TaxID=6265 RepID=A0A0B2W2Y3_TOXCA|nr:hypothetical protein Tcan_11005 [Toxocara canis]